MENEEQTELTGEESVVTSFKPFLLGIAGLAFVMALLVLLPMLLTYLSSGDARAPSQLHPTDPLGKSDHTVYKPIKSNK